MKRPRIGKAYVFRPVLGDRVMPEHYRAKSDQAVKVVQLPGAPRPGTMGQCHIQDAESGEFLGMVYVNSLQAI